MTDREKRWESCDGGLKWNTPDTNKKAQKPKKKPTKQKNTK